MKITPEVFETNFVVMPKHCNYMFPMIFGGSLFAELDLAAASCVNEALYSSACDSAVTHKFSGTYHAAAQSGDLVRIKANIISVRYKSIVVQVEAWMQPRATGPKTLTKIADVEFVFVTRTNGTFQNHGLEL